MRNVFDINIRPTIYKCNTTLAKCQIWNRNSSSFQKVLSSPHVFHFYFKKKFDPYLSSDFRTQFLFLYLFRIPFSNVKMTNTNKSRKGLAKSPHKSQPYSKNITTELCFLGLLAGPALYQKSILFFPTPEKNWLQGVNLP